MSGPKNGFNAAKERALRLNKNLYCKIRMNEFGDRVFEVIDRTTTHVVGRGAQARDAWGDALRKTRR